MPLNINFQQILLHMLNFVLLFFALYFLLYKPVKKFMDDRASRFQKERDELTAREQAAEALRAEYEEKLSAAEQEIAQNTRDAADKAAAEADELLKQAQEDARNLLEKARVQAQKEREQMLEDTRHDLSETATAMAAKILENTDYDAFLAAAERGDADGN